MLFQDFTILPVLGMMGVVFFVLFFSRMLGIPTGTRRLLRKSLVLCWSDLFSLCDDFFLEQLLSSAEGAWQMVLHDCVVLPYSGAADAPRHMLLGEALPLQQELATKISRGETPTACFCFD